MLNASSSTISTSPGPRRASWRDPDQVNVPGWIGTGGLAILGGALVGLVIAVLFQPPVAAAPSAGAVTITSDPPGLSLRVDHIDRGVTPLATMLPAGVHLVEVGDGDRRRPHQLRVKAGAEAVLHVDWQGAGTQP